MAGLSAAGAGAALVIVARAGAVPYQVGLRRGFHGREQAMFALYVERQPALALDLARGNVEQQREPLDLLVLAQAARASGDAAALAEARRLRDRVGLHDRRIDALL